MDFDGDMYRHVQQIVTAIQGVEALDNALDGIDLTIVTHPVQEQQNTTKK